MSFAISYSEQIQMIDDCMERESRMNDWECSFIESLHEQIGVNRFLSAKQIETLNRIWQRITEDG